MPGPVSKMDKKTKKRIVTANTPQLESSNVQLCTLVETDANVHSHIILTCGHSDHLRDGEADVMQAAPRESVVPYLPKKRPTPNSRTLENRSNGEDYLSRVGSFNASSMQAEPKDELASGSGRKTHKRKRDEGFKKTKRTGEVKEEKELTERLSQEARVWQYVCRRFNGHVVEEQQIKTASSSFDNGQAIPAGRFGTKRHGGGTSITKGRFGFKRRADFNEPVQNGITSITKVKVNHNVVTVTLTRDSRVVQEWVEQQGGSHFGLDLEWKPNFRKGQKENKVSLLQISTETECLLVQMLLLDSIPPALIALLKDPNRKFAGVGIRADVKKLQKDHGLVTAGEIELTPLAVAHFDDKSLKHAGLKTLAKRVLGFNMDKKKSVTISNWSRTNLTREQVEYACIDAWVSLAILKGLGEFSALAAA